MFLPRHSSNCIFMIYLPIVLHITGGLYLFHFQFKIIIIKFIFDLGSEVTALPTLCLAVITL